MTSVVIIDDEPLARALVAEYLQPHPEFKIIQECPDGFEGVKAIQHHKPGLIFLDIQMPRITGFEMLELIDQPPPVIFTTAHDEFAMKAFEVHAIDYLLKPFSRERFERALGKFKGEAAKSKAVQELLAITPQPEEQQRLVVKKGNNIVILPIQQVVYFEAFDDYVKVHTKDGFYLKKKTMSHYERVLEGKQFVRVHRSFLLNLQELTRIEPLEKDSHVALLRTGARLPLSAGGYARLKEVLGI